MLVVSFFKDGASYNNWKKAYNLFFEKIFKMISIYVEVNLKRIE
jgi:hypothetical protein